MRNSVIQKLEFLRDLFKEDNKIDLNEILTLLKYIKTRLDTDPRFEKLNQLLINNKDFGVLTQDQSKVIFQCLDDLIFSMKTTSKKTNQIFA